MQQETRIAILVQSISVRFHESHQVCSMLITRYRDHLENRREIETDFDERNPQVPKDEQ